MSGQRKYCFKNTRTGKFVKSITLGYRQGGSYIGIDFCDFIDGEVLELTAIAYEPNQQRIVELLNSLTSDIYAAVISQEPTS